MLQRECACGGSSGLGDKCDECRQNEMGLQRLAVTLAGSNMAPPIVHDVLRSPGQPLDRATRALLEPPFGHDFSRVRIHADAKAAESARAVAAHAYTVGSSIVFGAGRYAPGTESGRRLLAHELTHVVQQGFWRQDGALRVGPEGDAYEQQADAIAGEVGAHRIASDDTDEALEFPRQVGSASQDLGSSPAPVAQTNADAGAGPIDAGLPGGIATDCCTDAFNRGLAKDDYGGIICCNNVKNACVWQGNINRNVTNSSAQLIVADCVLAHESTHLDQVDCTGAAVERPNFKPGVDPKAAECNAYKVESSCYNGNISNCGTDADCKAQVQKEWDFAKKQIKKYC